MSPVAAVLMLVTLLAIPLCYSVCTSWRATGLRLDAVLLSPPVQPSQVQPSPAAQPFPVRSDEQSAYVSSGALGLARPQPEAQERADPARRIPGAPIT